MPLMHRMSLLQKFLILGLLAAIMVLVPTALYFREVAPQVSAAQREASASGMVIALNRVVQLAQQHRGMSAGALNGNAELARRRPAVSDQLNQAMAQLDTEIAAAQADQHIRQPWTTLRAQWSELEQGVAQAKLSAAESTGRHTQWISALLAINEEVLVSFGLSQDPTASLYFLIQASLTDMPALAENLGQLRAQGAGLLAAHAVAPESRGNVLALSRRASEVQKAMFRDLGRASGADAALNALLATRMEGNRQAVSASLTLVEQSLLKATVIDYSPSEFFDQLTRTIDGLYEFNGMAMHYMGDALHARAASLERMEALVLAVLLLGLVGSALLAVAFVRSIAQPVQDAVGVAAQVVAGNLDIQVRVRGSNELGQLMRALADMRSHLAQVVRDVRQGSESVATASAQIASGNGDLSARTESQASALEQTAASMEQLGATVRQNADSAQQASQLAEEASVVARQGGDIVAQVVETMRDIQGSSRRIADIIGVIDGIAFQTNILALNAAVEAARAGEQGRGFAVVASEVRSLAGRSAEAAREIKSLIQSSVERVEGGSALVDRAGATMQEVVSSIGRVTTLMREISSASREQASGVAQVGEAVTQMDQATQQNSALVEQMAAAATSLKAQAQDLLQTVARFRLEADSRLLAPQATRRPA